MRLTILGSGDAFGSGGRFNTCFWVEAEGRRLMIDFGASSPVAMKARGIVPNDIDGVLLSHLHGDHFGGLPFLLLDCQFHARREAPLTIAGPPGTRARLEAAMDVFFPGSAKNKWRFPLEVAEIAPGVPDTFLGFPVTTAEVVHRSGAPSTGVRIFAGGRTLAYSGDTEWTDALIPLAAGADCFVMECYDYDRELSGHMNFLKLKEKRPQIDAKRVIITHMNPTMLARIDEAKAAGFLVAHDGLVVDF